jgi:N-acetylglucosamine-6-phosphate deacetylase
MEASEHDLASVSEFLSTQGVTAWLPTLVPAPDDHYARAIDTIGKQMSSQRSLHEQPDGARVLGVHYEGPFVNTSQCGALHAEHFKTFSGPSDIDSLPMPEISNAVCMTTLAPEIEGGIDLVRELAKRGWIIAIGHTRAGVDVLDLAHEAGARHMTHFMNAMPRLVLSLIIFAISVGSPSRLCSCQRALENDLPHSSPDRKIVVVTM